MADHREAQKPYGEEIRTGSSDSILASLFRTILSELGINWARFNVLLERYVVRANIPLNVKEISSVRGNLKKELLKSVMSWKVFIKGLMFLNVRKFEITVRLYHASGMITEHGKEVILDPDDVRDELKRSDQESKANNASNPPTQKSE